MVTPVTVHTNCFQITQVPQQSWYQYDEIYPDTPIAKKRQQILHTLQAVLQPNVFNPPALYDGKKLLYASHQLQLVNGDEGVYSIQLGRTQGPPGTPGVFGVKLRKTSGNAIEARDFQRLVQVSSGNDPRIATATNILQLIIRQHANATHPSHNDRAYFSSAGSHDLQGTGLELWRGFFQSVRPTINKLLINVDTTMAVMYKGGRLTSIAMDYLRLRSNDVRALELEPNSPNFRKLQSFLMNRQITTKTTGTRTRTIYGLVPRAGYFEFEKDGQVITVEQYLRSLNIHIQFPKCFGVRLNKKSSDSAVVLPAEICDIIPGQPYKKNVTPDVVSQIVRFSTLKPVDRRARILTNGDSPVVNFTGNHAMTAAGMQVHAMPLTVQGTLLDRVGLQFQDQVVNPGNGSWNVMGRTFLEPASLERWFVVNLSHGIRDVSNVIRSLIKNAEQRGMRMSLRKFNVFSGSSQTGVADPAHVESQTAHADILQTIQRAGVTAARRLACDLEKLQLAVFILPQEAEQVRNMIKHICDCVIGIRSQCLRENKVARANDQYFNNIALKLNARLGGQNCLPQSAALNWLLDRPTLIIGADVSHAAPGVQRPSIASLVYSHDQYGSQYCAITKIQSPRVEMIADLQAMMEEALRMFGGKNKTAPQRILFFRDGVSEGEFARVGVNEIGAVQNAIDKVWAEMNDHGPKPQLTFLVVGKRHHLVFFPQHNSPVEDQKTGNCVAGFVTSQGHLQNPVAQDFYLQSHSAIQGTSRSAHYTILVDEIFGDQRLTQLKEACYALCHMYGKATRSVSIPTPVYYADLVCARGKFHINPSSSLRLDDDASSVSTVGGGGTFDLSRWMAEFKSVKGSLKPTMYFL